MTTFTFTYSFSNVPEVFTTTVESETLAEAFSLFYDQTTDDAFGSVPTIHDVTTDEIGDRMEREHPAIERWRKSWTT